MSGGQTEGFVLEARGPDAGMTTGRQKISMLVRLPGGDLAEIEDTPKAKVEQWIVAGMTVPVVLDPRRPLRGEVVTDAIPPLSQRMADRDWTLCDLEEVTIRVRLARFDLEHDADPATRARYWEQLTAWKRQKVATRPGQPVTDEAGRLRGTADLVSHEGVPSSRRDRSRLNAGWRGKRIFRVWPFGTAPYALIDDVDFAPRMDDRRHVLLEGGDVPVSIDPADPAGVRFEWEEHADPVVSRGEREIEMILAAVDAGTITQAELDQGYTDTTAPLRPRYLELVQARGLDVSQRHKDFFAS